MNDERIGALIGSLTGAAIGALGELTRQGIAAALRETAGAVERGQVVSDDAIDALQSALDRVRAERNRR